MSGDVVRARFLRNQNPSGRFCAGNRHHWLWREVESRAKDLYGEVVEVHIQQVCAHCPAVGRRWWDGSSVVYLRNMMRRTRVDHGRACPRPVFAPARFDVA